MNDRLRILHVTHMPFDLNLGGPKACIELMNQISSKMGWTVDWFSGSDAPLPSSYLARRFVGNLFRFYAVAHVRQVAHDYDVIIAEQGSLPRSKKSLGFKGLLIVRSSGLTPLLYQGDQRLLRQSEISAIKLSSRLANAVSSVLSGGLSPFNRSLEYADLAVLLNPNEAEYVTRHAWTKRPPLVIPNGLPRETLVRLAQCARERKRVGMTPKVVFIGRWSPLKGANVLPDIVRLIRQEVPGCCFKLVGVGTEPGRILPRFAPDDRPFMTIVPQYDNTILSTILADCTIGMFPSHVEGFGLAVLEKLAAGIPCVCFDIPGPREIISSQLADLLVPYPDASLMAQRIVALIRESALAQEERVQRCIEAAARFDLEAIGDQWINAIVETRKQIQLNEMLG